MADTVFDQILTGALQADVVYEDEVVLAFRDISPVAPVHVLVIPKKKVASFAQLRSEDPAEVGSYITKVSEVASRLGLDNDGYRIIFNCGRNGLQSVDYIHAHIIGGKELSWPPGC